jgi:magnesium/cobalt transport protein CorA
VVEEIDWGGTVPHLGRSSVLWIDLERPDDTELRQLAEALDLSDESLPRLSETRAAPQFADYEHYLQVTACAPSDDGELVRVAFLVSKRWVVTVRDRPLEVLETFRERACGSGETGTLEGLEFLADVLEWVLASYFEAFERIEIDLEEIDTASMAGEIESPDEVLRRLVEVRHEIGRLRRALASHREPILALTRPELEAIASTRSAERFARLRERLEDAVQAARDSREMVVGSFDVVIASTGQRTNEIVKVLTLVSVLILPGSLLAGVMGMNFRLGIFHHAVYFWVILAAMLAIAVATLALARMRDWI